MPFKCYAMMQHYQGRIHQNCPDHILSVNFSSLCPERGSAYFMGLELHPSVALQGGAWHILVAYAYADRRHEPSHLLAEV